MRISGGVGRGIPLLVPKGGAVRPATDGMRQAVFSSLGAQVVGATFWDLFAGSGAYGLEALSRGALGGVFVERDARAAAVIERNLAAVVRGLRHDVAAAAVVTADALAWVPPAGGVTADLVFVDPPYNLVAGVAPVLFERLGRFLAPKPRALILLELPGEISLTPPGWECVKRLGKGRRQPTVAAFRRA